MLQALVCWVQYTYTHRHAGSLFSGLSKIVCSEKFVSALISDTWCDYGSSWKVDLHRIKICEMYVFLKAI